MKLGLGKDTAKERIRIMKESYAQPSTSNLFIIRVLGIVASLMILGSLRFNPPSLSFFNLLMPQSAKEILHKVTGIRRHLSENLCLYPIPQLPDIT